MSTITNQAIPPTPTIPEDRFALDPEILLAGAEQTDIFQRVTRRINNHGLVHTYSREECLMMGITPKEYEEILKDKKMRIPQEDADWQARAIELMPRVVGYEMFN